MDYKPFLDNFQNLMETTITARNQATLGAFAGKKELLEHTDITEGVKACLSTFKIEREKYEAQATTNSEPLVVSPQVTDAEIVVE